MKRRSAVALPLSRRTEMLRLVAEQGSVSVPELADLFRVSTDTVRRDLDSLASSGAVLRTHGGAVRAEGAGIVPVADRIVTQADAKTRIAAAAAQLIESGETLMVNGGSTTLAFALMLPADRSVGLITNSVSILDQIDTSAFTNVYAIGGELFSVSRVMIGPVIFPHSDRIHVDTAVIGVRSIHPSRGISTATVAEAAMISEMMRAARRTIVVADETKFTQSAFAAIAPLSEIDILVTSATPPEPMAEALAEAEVQVIVAP
ncbi:DeoR/GlpR family DNA-binding transcription regulator [Kaistia geumhonensis]|uniref:DeoR/GlpR family transcriptional regulator of sugar metabolism n=1 Tax=Kaistia geumhonensis TaxID=410839 RepID=A0ABU0M5D5_9HYPH|nr:DeoR/GlpR family DNA-binding transcription regulator [Kaistia geumhonensis]MCX5478631.1 DeoR/GlpR family DNA-binding transcription regulator [Kaistia geumhonensis]MDQ0516151.1 DeoR/GlpR family transcriptional regulator of sugar metabolism [Kaistia geumhonensis]